MRAATMAGHPWARRCRCRGARSRPDCCASTVATNKQMATTAPTPASAHDIFATTRWTVVLAAGARGVADARGTADADHALEELCRAYWFPLYAYVRRRGYAKEDAE